MLFSIILSELSNFGDCVRNCSLWNSGCSCNFRLRIILIEHLENKTVFGVDLC